MSNVLSIERVVALATPVFAGVSGWLCTLAAKYLPGAPNLDKTQVTAVFVAGSLYATSAALKWLHGRQVSAVINAPAVPASAVEDDGAPPA